MESSVYDVIIIGGGPAGCSAALGLFRANPGAKFLLVDDSDSSQFKIGESLPPEASQILRYLSPEVSAQLARDTSDGRHISCTGNASAWGTEKLEETFSIMNPFGAGWHLDRVRFEDTLRDAVAKLSQRPQASDSAVGPGGGAQGVSGKHGFVKARFVGVEKDKNGIWRVELQRLEADGSLGNSIYCTSSWLLDCTGRKASVAHKLGAKTQKQDSLLAFYTLFTSPLPDSDRDRRTLLEASPTGWWYTSQLTSNLRVVVYHTDDTEPTSKVARKRDGFADLLADETHYIKDIIENMDYRPLLASKTGSYPKVTSACSSILQPLGEEHTLEGSGRRGGWYAIGDAAMAFDPLSSQGMITALECGCSVGTILGKRLLGDAVANDTSIEGVYMQIRGDYEKKKRYYYANSRFDTEFWQRRRQ